LFDAKANFANRQEFRQGLQCFPFHCADEVRPPPLDNVIVFPQPDAFSKICHAANVVESTDRIDTPQLEHHDPSPIGSLTVGQQNVTGLQDIPQPADQADFPLAFSRISAETKVENHAAGKGHDAPNPGNWKAESRLLVAGLRIGPLVLEGIGHADCRAVEHVYPTPLPQPLRGGSGVQRSADKTCHGCEESLGQPLSGLAIGSGSRRASALATGQTMGNQPGHGSATGMICAEHLAQKDPERHQRRKQALLPVGSHRLQSRGNRFRRQDIRQRQITFLKKLLPQKTDLLPNPSLLEIAHGHGLPAGDQMAPSMTIFHKKATRAYAIWIQQLPRLLTQVPQLLA
jgi:hypothetical protein